MGKSTTLKIFRVMHSPKKRIAKYEDKEIEEVEALTAVNASEIVQALFPGHRISKPVAWHSRK